MTTAEAARSKNACVTPRESDTSPARILVGHSPRVQALATRLRALIRAAAPAAKESAYLGWHGIGYRHPRCGYFCGIFPQNESVRLLFEHGILLPDPDRLLVGNGKQTRYVDIRRQQDIKARPLKRLIAAALALKRG